MGPPAFAGDDVHDAIAIDIGERERVQLGKLDAGDFLVGFFGEDYVLFEGDGAVGGAGLFEPGEAVAVGVFAGDNIGEAVAVDIHDEHVSAAFGREGEGMKRPLGIADERGGLLPPALTGEEIVAAVAVDVAVAEAVGEALPFGIRGGGGMEDPGAGGVFGIRRGVAEAIIGHANQDGRAGGEERAEGGRLVVHGEEHDVTAPDAAGGAGVFIPRGINAGKTEHEHIGPGVAVEIGGEAEKIIGVDERVEGLGGINLVAGFEIGTGIPVGTGDDIEVAVLVDVGEVRALGEKFGAEFDAAVGGIGGGGERGGGGEEDAGAEGDTGEGAEFHGE